jgi:hypothetical protein
MQGEVLAFALRHAWGESIEDLIARASLVESKYAHLEGAAVSVWAEAGRKKAKHFLDFAQKRRAGFAELLVLRRLVRAGCSYQQHHRDSAGNADWIVASRGKLIDVEVGSIAEDIEWVNVIDAALHGSIRAVGMCEPTDYKPVMLNEDELRTLSFPTSLHVEHLAKLIWEHRFGIDRALASALSMEGRGTLRNFSIVDVPESEVALSVRGFGYCALVELKLPGNIHIRYEFKRAVTVRPSPSGARAAVRDAARHGPPSNDP